MLVNQRAVERYCYVEAFHYAAGNDNVSHTIGDIEQE